MSFLAYVRVEAGRVFRSRGTWLVMLLTLLSPLFGYTLYQPALTSTKASQLLANPALAGALGGTVLFALLTLYELSRVHVTGTAVLTESIVSPMVMQGARLVGLLLAATATGLLTGLVYLPYTAAKLGNLFVLWDYVMCYGVVMLLGLWLGCLLAATAYQITRRVDISFVIIAACVLLSMTSFVNESFLLRWINPIIPILSDDFSNTQVLRMAAYNRLFWLLIFGGAWVLSQLCTRRYGKGVFGSLTRNLRKVALPITAIVLVVAGVTAYAQQPFVNHAPLDGFDDEVDWPDGISQLSTTVDARPDLRRGTFDGTATYHMRNMGSEPVTQLMSINCGYTVKKLTIDGEPVPFEDLNDDIVRVKHIRFQLPTGKDIVVEVEYGGYPQMWSISESTMGGDEVSPRYIYLTGAAFAPIMEATWEDSYTNVGEITLPENLVPLLYGTAEPEKLAELEDGSVRWRLEETMPLIYLYAADYVVEDVSVEEMSVGFYYSRKHQAVMERVDIAETLKDVMRYCVNNIGSLSFADGDYLKLVQMSAFMFGGYAGGGMSVMGESSFVEDILSDPLRGASGQEVMAHEIIHQWWGLGRMFNEYDEDVDPAWSAEGFTVYSTYRMMKEKYGDAYAQKNYVDVWQREADALSRDFYQRHPEYLSRLPEQYAASVLSAHDSTMKYCIMPLKILKAAELVGGEDRMDEIMRELFSTEDLIMPYYLSYEDFLDACGLTKEDLAL